MKLFLLRLVACAVMVALSISTFAKDKASSSPKAKAIAATDPAAAGTDFVVQGEYVGEIKDDAGPVKLGAQIIALGGGRFHAVGLLGGLPGSGWDGKTRVETDGQVKDGVVTFTSGSGHKGTIRLDAKDAGGKPQPDSVFTVSDADGKTLGTLKKVLRTSPTLGAKPPAGAVVLFDGTSADAFVEGHVKDGLLLEGTTTKQKFRNYKIHLEFMIPFMPEARGQARGNSGYYSQGRYETQILDSFGLVSQNNDCGAIYGIKAPRINMCYPPLSWQTYDVDYTAAEYKDGKKIKNALLTVLHNGVEVQHETEATHATTAAPVGEGPKDGPVYLQNHGNPVRFRNIWLVEKELATGKST